MIPVVFNGSASFLLDDRPQWDGDFVLTSQVNAVNERGLSGRETRRVTGDTLRLEAQFTCLLQGDVALTNVRNSLQALNTQQVLCPCWPATIAPEGTPTLTAAYYATFNANGTYNSIVAAAALPVALQAVPLMVGYLKDIPDPKLLTDVLATVEYHFVDADIYPLTPPAFAAPAGLVAAGGMRPLFPFTPEWSTVPESGGAEVDIDRRQIGELRTLASAYYAQRSRRQVSQAFKLFNADAFNLLAFFKCMGGLQNNFWLGAASSEAVLASNVAATDTALQVDVGTNLGTNAFVLLNDNHNRVPLAVSSVVGNAWNLAEEPGIAFSAATTRVESLVLSRFNDTKLVLNFSSPTICKTTIKFCELPWETNAVAGETYGTTMGALPVTAILFVFTLTTPSGTMTWYFTNFERNLQDAVPNTYLCAPMMFDKITDTYDLERTTTKLTARNFANNPLSLLLPFQLEWPLMVEIIEADITGSTAGNLRTYFYGEVGSVSVEPPFIDADCMSLSSIFDRNVPRRLYQRTDNWTLFETANGLVPANWQWNAVVVSYNAATCTLIVNTITSSNGSTLVAHWFAAGYCVITTTVGGNPITQARMITDNLAPAAGQMTLYLSTPLTTVPNAGDVINMFAGYDQQASTATNKFNNYANFGGFPFMPIANPVVLQALTPSGGGKK